METWKAFEQNEISHSAAHHLMAIDDLFTRFGYARVSDVARLLDITRGSVSISLQPLKKAGLVEQDENRHLRLSPGGQALVDAIKAKRTLLTRLLNELVGVNPDQADIDACKIEHLVSNTTAQRLITLFRFLDSGEPTAQEFMAALTHYTSDCAHDPSNCPTCESNCLAERIEEQL